MAEADLQSQRQRGFSQSGVFQDCIKDVGTIVIKMQAMIRTHVGTLVRPHDAECVVSPCRSCLAPFTDMFIEGFFRFSAALEPTMMLGSCAEVLPSAG